MNLSLCNTDIIRSRDNQIQISVAGNKYQNIITGWWRRLHGCCLPYIPRDCHVGLPQAAPRACTARGRSRSEDARRAALPICPTLYATNFSTDLVFVIGAINNFSRKKKSLKRKVVILIIPNWSSSRCRAVHRFTGGEAGRAQRVGRRGLGVGGPAGRLSSREKLPSWAVLV